MVINLKKLSASFAMAVAATTVTGCSRDMNEAQLKAAAELAIIEDGRVPFEIKPQSSLNNPKQTCGYNAKYVIFAEASLPKMLWKKPGDEKKVDQVFVCLRNGNATVSSASSPAP